MPTRSAVEWFQFVIDSAPALMWLYGADSRTFYFNTAWRRFTRRVDWTETLHPADLTRCLGEFERAFTTRQAFEIEFRLLHNGRDYRLVTCQARPIRGPAGPHLGYIGTCTPGDDAQRVLLDGVRDVGLCVLTANGRVASWNSGADELRGYAAAEVLGHRLAQLFPEDASLLRSAAAKGRVESDGWRVRKDGAKFWAHVVTTAVRDEAGELRGFAQLTTDNTERKQVEDDLVTHVHELARLSAEHVRSVERLEQLRRQQDAIERGRLLDEERKRIAGDLHDGVMQAFFGIGLVASAALAEAPRCESGDRLAASLSRVGELAVDGATHLREAVFALSRDEVTYRQLEPSLQTLAREFRERTGVEADVVVTGARRGLPANIAEALYATAREALANVEDHANAHAVVLGLHFDRREVTLSVQDDGAGGASFALHAVPERAVHPGLGHIGALVHDLRGKLDAGPNPDGGFLVRTRLPLVDDSAA
jgi:PAS domain S-box-containing protein